MMKKGVRVASIFLVSYFIIFADANPGNQKRANDTGATPQGLSRVVNANNQFAIDFYLKLQDKEKGNIFFSPYSISTALAMTYEGARNKTTKEMESVFHFPEDNTTRRSSFYFPNPGERNWKHPIHR